MDVDWSDLQRDLLQLILEKLVHISDQSQFGCVCSSWRTVLLEHRNRCFPPNIPGLLIPCHNCNTKCQTRRFLPLPIGKEVINNHNDDNDDDQNQLLAPPLLPVPHLSLCCGSYEDWLVMIENNMNMYVLNPFSGTRIDLPPVTALPKPRPVDTRRSKWYVKKAILSTSPSSSSSYLTTNCIVMVLFGYHKFAFCEIGEKKSWRLFENSPHILQEAIFYKGKFFFVNYGGKVFICNDITAAQPKITEFAMPPKSASKYAKKWYLVESSLGGDLLLILRVKNVGVLDGTIHSCDNEFELEPEEDDNDDDDEEKFDLFDYDNDDYRGYVATFITKTVTFEVFKLDAASGTTWRTWLDVKNLGGEALFVGLNQSFSLSESRLHAIQAATILLVTG